MQLVHFQKAPSTDKNWYTNMTTTNQVKASPFFTIPRVRGRGLQFVIRHFASEVTYDVNGFVEKNLDAVNAEQVEVLKRSKVRFVACERGVVRIHGTSGIACATRVSRSETMSPPTPHLSGLLFVFPGGSCHRCALTKLRAFSVGTAQRNYGRMRFRRIEWTKRYQGKKFCAKQCRYEKIDCYASKHCFSLQESSKVTFI